MASPTFYNELVALGAQGLPTTVIEQNGQRYIVTGFAKARLEKLLH